MRLASTGKYSRCAGRSAMMPSCRHYRPNASSAARQAIRKLPLPGTVASDTGSRTPPPDTPDRGLTGEAYALDLRQCTTQVPRLAGIFVCRLESDQQ